MSCLIAAPCSGSGKTLLSLCLIAAARARGETLQPFKVGPDYLDPQLLGAVAGRVCRNLDPLLCGAPWVRRCFHWHGSRAERVLVEGVMGLFDGRGPGSEGSSAEVAALLDLPVVLVVEASRQAGSLAALVRGFRDHGPPPVRLAGVVLNRVGSERHRALLAEALDSLGVPLLGVLPPDPGLALPSRHLGLLPPQELHDFGERQRLWASLAETHLDLERIWPLLRPPPARPEEGDPITWALETVRPAAAAPKQAVPSRLPAPLPVAIASDAAFHFRYPEMGELLRGVGLEPLDWSPLADMPLPSGCRAVVLPGGYPELHAARLAASTRSLAQLREAAARGLPIVAECGGLLLLGKSLADPEGGIHAMAGVLPFCASRGPLSLGYRRAAVGKDGLLVRRGEHLSGHEFHRWQLSDTGCAGVISTAPDPVAASPGLWQLEGWGVASNSEGWTAKNVHASWLHLHWAGCPAIPWRLALAAAHAAPLSRNVASPSLGRTGPAMGSNDGG
jgi:cobyrinic acid a,c-diamide synthase